MKIKNNFSSAWINRKKITFLKKNFFFFLLILFLLIKTFFIISANEGNNDSVRYNNLADKLRCPTCQGLSIKDSEAGFSNIIKGKVFELIKKGYSDEEIIEYFVKRYGEWILRSPKKEGFNLLIWILPSLGVFTGLIWVFLRFKISGKNEKEIKIEELSLEEEKKVVEDLKKFEKD